MIMNVLFFYCTISCIKCQPLQVMQSFRRYEDLYTLTTSYASQALIDIWVGKGNLDLCYVQNQY